MEIMAIGSSTSSVRAATSCHSILTELQIFNCWKSPESLWVGKEGNFGGKRLALAKKFKMNCSPDKEMDVSTSALADAVAECSNEMDIREPNISTIVMNFENKFDPYDAMSTPLYQTATFKQGAWKYVDKGAE